MEWQGGLEIPFSGNKHGHVKARFLVNPEKDQSTVMAKLTTEYFGQINVIKIEKYEPIDIYTNLVITKKYRELIYVRFEPTSFEDKRF
jgi:hypothetical protein